MLIITVLWLNNYSMLVFHLNTVLLLVETYNVIGLPVFISHETQ